MDALGTHYLEQAVREFRGLKALADRAMQQTADPDFFRTFEAVGNSIAINVKHIAGNLRSRWTDFLTTDGASLSIPRGESTAFNAQRGFQHAASPPPRT